MDDKEEQEEELTALRSIYEEESVLSVSNDEGEHGGQFSSCFPLPQPFYITTETQHRTEQDEREEPKLIQIKYLPPVTLNFALPQNYPSECPPVFTLTCKWLTRPQLSALCHRLDEFWDEQKGCVVLFQWINFLQNEAFEFLELASPLDLSVVVRQQCRSGGFPLRDHDPRGIQDIAAQDLLLPAIQEFDMQEDSRQFQKSVFACKVCFLEKLGSQCIQFNKCDHVYCKDCMKNYFTIQIGDGNVVSLNCPEDKCESQAQPAQVKELVSPQLFSRYDQLLLKTSLDTMQDVVYCPRPMCQCPVILERESSMGSCPACCYVFCVLCKLVFHGLSPCKIKSEEVRKLREQYEAADEEGKRFMEKKYGKRAIEQALEETWSNEWLEKFSKQCPSCGTYIQKIDGCNKMTCTKCRAYFCWLCGASLSRTNPYNHFGVVGSECFNRLFEGLDPLEDLEADEEDDFVHFL